MIQTDICCYFGDNNYTTCTMKRKLNTLSLNNNKTMRSTKKQERNNGERIIDLTKEEGTVICAFLRETMT